MQFVISKFIPYFFGKFQNFVIFSERQDDDQQFLEEKTYLIRQITQMSQ